MCMCDIEQAQMNGQKVSDRTLKTKDAVARKNNFTVEGEGVAQRRVGHHSSTRESRQASSLKEKSCTIHAFHL